MNAREKRISDICTQIFDISGLLISYDRKTLYYKTQIVFSGSVEDCELVSMSVLWAVTQLEEEREESV